MDARELIEEIIKRNTAAYPDDIRLSDLENWDSLKGVRLIIRLEEAIGRQLLEDEIAGLQSIRDVAQFLQRGV